jgi:hypothetical protein
LGCFSNPIFSIASKLSSQMGCLIKPYFFDCQQAVISNGLLTQTLSLLLCSRWVFNLRLLIQASLIHLRKLKTPSLS